MAGMAGFQHRCNGIKAEKDLFKKSISEANFSKHQIDLIWDFYVTHSLCGTGLSRTIMDYGWNATQDKNDGYPALEQGLADVAGINKFCIIRAKTINDTLKAMDLFNDHLCISHPRAVLMQNFTLQINENEEVSFKSQEARINAIFRHIRNAMAHGNTYFFQNGFMLLEDKAGKQITSAIMIKQRTLLDWIEVVDKNRIYYKLNSETGEAQFSNISLRQH